MEHLSFAIIALFVLAFGAISKRISTTMITPPMLFAAFGIVLGGMGLGLIEVDPENHFIILLAEITLVLVLFTDASRIDFALLKKEHNIPIRLLGIGLPLTMLAGTGLGWLFFPEMSLFELLVLGIILAPTDAALGQAVVSSEKMPVRIRQALNVESGLNDGLALPALLFFACLAATTHQASNENFLVVALLQITLGPLAGIIIGFLGARLVVWGHKGGWMNESFRELSSLAVALLAFSGAELIHGNGFLAAFCAGIAMGNTMRRLGDDLTEFTEAEGQLLTLLTFMFFGAIMLPLAMDHMQWQIVVYALLSLTVVRMLPVAVSLIGSKLKMPTVLFLGWFGPRGVASIIYVLVVLEFLHENPHRETLFNVAMVTVLLSIIAHGLTAWPGVSYYAKRFAAKDKAEEMKQVKEMPVRVRLGGKTS